MVLPSTKSEQRKQVSVAAIRRYENIVAVDVAVAVFSHSNPNEENEM